MSLGGYRPHIPVSISNKMDCFSSKQRSVVMSKIRSTNTRQELLAIRWFSERDYAFDSYRKDMPGTPDIVFENYKLIIFIHGCFWHHHKNCTRATFPKTNKSYWVPKIKNNVKRDISVARKLRRNGWHVVTVWECHLKKDIDKTLSKIENRFML